MKKKFSMLAMLTVAIAGFLALTMFSTPSFAASQASANGVTFSLSGQYIARAFWSQNQYEDFYNASGFPTQNTYDMLTQRLRLNSSIKYDTLANGMPLAALFVQFDLTNGYNGTSDGYGINGWYALGQTPAPTGFNHDFNTFGLRQAYIRLITPIGAIMFGRMPVKFGLGIAVNTNADGIGDFIPLKSADLGIFAGTLIGSVVTGSSNPVGNTNNYANFQTIYPGSQYSGQPIPGAAGDPYYTHIQMGTIPTLELMTLKPIYHTSLGFWLTAAHLNQFGTTPSEVIATGAPSTTFTPVTIDSMNPTANITFGGLSAKYSYAGTTLAGEFDLFRGRIIASNQGITAADGNPGYLPLPVKPSGNNQYDSVDSYDLYLSGSTNLSTSLPVTVGAKFGIGAPISAGHYNFTYYSQIQNTRTFFGDVIGSNWQPIQMASPGIGYMYAGPTGIFALGSNLSNKWVAMVDATEHLPGANALQESVVYARWLRTNLTVPGDSYSTSMFAGHNIGTEFDLNYTHHFTKTLAFQAWGAYVWTGNGVDSFTATSTGGIPGTAAHKNVVALGSAVIWNF
ncbi:MAG: hypothetical protein M1407_05050 [Deltaproteobacteria bacterium]|nr:hypothetical protein [Deltaproteobacteria bacterium]